MNESMESWSGVVSGHLQAPILVAPVALAHLLERAYGGSKKDMRLKKRSAKGWAGGDRI